MVDEQTPLSDREIEVLELVATGASNQDIARQLFISVNTVKVHLRNIFEKLGVQSRTEATLCAIRHGLVVVDEAETMVPDLLPGRLSPEYWPPATARWQRVYVTSVLLLALALLVLPLLGREGGSESIANPITDRPGAGNSSAWVATSRWTKNADLPVPRTRLALAAHNGRLYAIGGDRASGVTGQVDAYSPEADAWSGRAPKPTAVSNIGAVVVGGRIYVPGGCTSLTSVTDQMEVYAPADDIWAQATPLPMPVCAYALTAVGRQVFVVGGWDGQHFTDRVFVYDTAQDTWTERSPMPSARGFAAAGAVDEVVYVVGGYDGVSELADMLAYDVSADVWSEQSSMTVGRAGLGVAVIGGEVYAIGGGWQSYLATNERYDPETNMWSVFESPMLGQWRNLGVAGLDTEIYAVGGWNGDYMGVNQAYRALFRIILPVMQ